MATAATRTAEVFTLQTCLVRHEANVGIIPRLIRRIIRDECWLEWLTPEGRHVRWNAADFRLFLTSKRPDGCETSLDIVERVLRGTDAWEPYLELIRGNPGAPEGHPVHPDRDHTTGQFSRTINRYPVTVNGSPNIIGVIPAATPSAPVTSTPKRERDYSREAPTGNSTSYNLRRLGKERPDLYERVKAGELKPKTAMRLAGLVTLEFSIPVDPEGAARRILKRFDGEPLRALVLALAGRAGIEVVEHVGTEGG